MSDIRHLTRSKPTDVSIDLGDGDTITVSFDRNKITPVWMGEAQKRDESQDSLSLPKALAEVILGWDVTNDGVDFPPTPENLAVLSYPAQSELLTHILRSAMPSSEEGNGSTSTSATPAVASTSEPAAPQNGPQPSPSPAPLASPSPT